MCLRPSAAFVAVLLLAACRPPAAGNNDVPVGLALVEMGDALNDVRSQSAELQAQIDSLRGALARQDTLLRRVAAGAGVAVP